MPNLLNVANFFSGAVVTNSLNPFDPGTAKYRHKASILVGRDKLVKVRHYKDKYGAKRVTIEIDVS